jgi:FeS assembly SUF system protein
MTEKTPDPEAVAQPENQDPEILRQRVIEVLKTIYDPEIPVNIYELGLVYSIDAEPSGAVKIVMTLTSPACPVAGSLPPEVETKAQSVPGVIDARVELVWEPPWNMAMMSEAARLQLNLM